MQEASGDSGRCQFLAPQADAEPLPLTNEKAAGILSLKGYEIADVLTLLSGLCNVEQQRYGVEECSASHMQVV